MYLDLCNYANKTLFSTTVDKDRKARGYSSSNDYGLPGADEKIKELEEYQEAVFSVAEELSPGFNKLNDFEKSKVLRNNMKAFNFASDQNYRYRYETPDNQIPGTFQRFMDLIHDLRQKEEDADIVSAHIAIIKADADDIKGWEESTDIDDLVRKRKHYKSKQYPAPPEPCRCGNKEVENWNECEAHWTKKDKITYNGLVYDINVFVATDEVGKRFGELIRPIVVEGEIQELVGSTINDINQLDKSDDLETLSDTLKSLPAYDYSGAECDQHKYVSGVAYKKCQKISEERDWYGTNYKGEPWPLFRPSFDFPEIDEVAIRVKSRLRKKIIKMLPTPKIVGNFNIYKVAKNITISELKEKGGEFAYQDSRDVSSDNSPRVKWRHFTAWAKLDGSSVSWKKIEDDFSGDLSVNLIGDVGIFENGKLIAIKTSDKIPNKAHISVGLVDYPKLSDTEAKYTLSGLKDAVRVIMRANPGVSISDLDENDQILMDVLFQMGSARSGSARNSWGTGWIDNAGIKVFAVGYRTSNKHRRYSELRPIPILGTINTGNLYDITKKLNERGYE